MRSECELVLAGGWQSKVLYGAHTVWAPCIMLDCHPPNPTRWHCDAHVVPHFTITDLQSVLCCRLHRPLLWHC
jgi:hypothetical protein